MRARGTRPTPPAATPPGRLLSLLLAVVALGLPWAARAPAAGEATAAGASAAGSVAADSVAVGRLTAPYPPVGEPWAATPEAYLVAGSFVMGGQGEVYPDVAAPAHLVTLTRPFWLGRTEVTVAQFARFVEATGYRTVAEVLRDHAAGDAAAHGAEHAGAEAAAVAALQAAGPWWARPGRLQGGDWPVTLVALEDAVRYANWLSRREGLAPAYRFVGGLAVWDRQADGYRLPTEAEWEYAARCGGACTVPPGSDPSRLGPVWHSRPSEVGLAGLTDAVLEWCWDGWSPYPDGEVTDPVATADDGTRVIRGASRFRRDWADAHFTSDLLGFRLARNAPPLPAADPAAGRVDGEGGTGATAGGDRTAPADVLAALAEQARIAAAVRWSHHETVVADSLRAEHREARSKVQKTGAAVLGLGMLSALVGAGVASSAAVDPVEPAQPEPAAVATGEVMVIVGVAVAAVGALVVYGASRDAELSPAEARQRARELIGQPRLPGGGSAVGLTFAF